MHNAAIDLLTLRLGDLQLDIAPAVGGSIARFCSHRTAAPAIEWLRPAAPDALAARNPLGMASFPLLPWCNRIRAGRAEFAGRAIRVPPNHPEVEVAHPLHGLGWQLPWQVLAQSDTAVTLALSCPADAVWPWRFEARQTYALMEAGLHASLSLTNRDEVDMPAGIGHHPYFLKHGGALLQSDTRAMWCADPEVMPTELQETPEVHLLREGVDLQQLNLDNNFAGWQRRADIRWPQLGAGLRLQAESPLDFFVLYCPTELQLFCAEPVSQCTDALNLADSWPQADIGGAVLAPGQTLQGDWSLQVQRPQSPSDVA